MTDAQISMYLPRSGDDDNIQTFATIEDAMEAIK